VPVDIAPVSFSSDSRHWQRHGHRQANVTARAHHTADPDLEPVTNPELSVHASGGEAQCGTNDNC
jgi:hypothetical protein